MPWWSWAWVFVLLAMTIGGAALDVKDREPAWYTALGLGSGLICVVCILNFFGVLRSGDLAVPASVAIVALLYVTWQDLYGDQEVTRGEGAVMFLLTVAAFVPAAVLGFLVPEV